MLTTGGLEAAVEPSLDRLIGEEHTPRSTSPCRPFLQGLQSEKEERW